MNKGVFLLALTCLLLHSAFGHASTGHQHLTRADAHAPIGVMGEHNHKTGEWMLSYRYMQMFMDDNYSGTNKLSDAEVLTSFMVVPTEMTMEMHMLGAMYAPTDDLTFMIMWPYIRKTMDHMNRAGAKFSTEADGFGDLQLSAIFSLQQWLEEKVLFNFGISVPTGSVNQRDRTLAGPDQKLPYPMQIGSGTVDLIPGFTFTKNMDQLQMGAQTKSTIRLGKNSEQYRLGNRYNVTVWAAYSWLEWLSTSFRVDANFWKDIKGADPEINPIMVQTANAGNQGGERVDLVFGTNLVIPKHDFKDHRLAFEFGFPVYQNLNGPQLGIEYFWTLGWQKSF